MCILSQPYYDAVVAVLEAVARGRRESVLIPGSTASRCDAASAAANDAVAMLLRMCCVVFFSF